MRARASVADRVGAGAARAGSDCEEVGGDAEGFVTSAAVGGARLEGEVGVSWYGCGFVGMCIILVVRSFGRRHLDMAYRRGKLLSQSFWTFVSGVLLLGIAWVRMGLSIGFRFSFPLRDRD